MNPGLSRLSALVYAATICVMLLSDVTREREAQEALKRADRVMVAGWLAATVAHEINNPLEAVFNFIYLAMSDPAIPEGPRVQLGKAVQELNRVAHVTRQTLRFHRTAPGIAEVDAADAPRTGRSSGLMSRQRPLFPIRSGTASKFGHRFGA